MKQQKVDVEPLYRLHIGKSGESNALYISKKMGISEGILKRAKLYMDNKDYNYDTLKESKKGTVTEEKETSFYTGYDPGDRVLILDENISGVVYKAVDRFNNIIVLVKEEFKEVNCKRVKLEARAADLYPADYDLNQLFVKFKDRKLEHDIARGSKKALKKIQKEMKERHEGK